MNHDQFVCEIRCPVHGFIGLTELERDIVNHAVFQRLRRIKQLGWTDYIYPGASHTRFEHSLGVMHLASRLYEAVVRSSEDTLKEGFKYTDAGLARDWQIVRLAALLHDVGHPPFSHAAEMLLPMRESEGSSLVAGSASKPPVEQYGHEDYSVEIIERKLKDLIEQHPCNHRNYRITTDEITPLISKRTTAGSSTLFWKDIISGQLDADRMDYLLRDSLHAGVSYGRYDHDRIVSSICAVRRDRQRQEESSEPKIAIMKGGMYAAEALIVARYWITKQVYFHKTRLACDYHIGQALGKILSFEAGGSIDIAYFPRPDSNEELDKYLKWDDYRVMELLVGEKGGEHGRRLMTRNHYRLVCELEVSDASVGDLTASKKRNDAIVADLGSMVKHDFSPKASWYKTNPTLELLVVDNDGKTEIGLLSEHSAFMKSINIGYLRFIYVDRDDSEKARAVYKKFLERESAAEAASAETAVEAKPESASPNSAAEAAVKDLQLKLEPPLNDGKTVQRETTPQKGGVRNAI
jgi:HD superfamily phosphohydrolase